MEFKKQIIDSADHIFKKKEELLASVIKTKTGCSELDLDDIKKRGEFVVYGQGDSKTTTFVFDGEPLLIFTDIKVIITEENFCKLSMDYKILIEDGNET